MVKIVLSFILLCVMACPSRDLNLNALDLNRYVANLSEHPENFPPYVKLMTPDHDGVVPREVADLIKFFEDKTQPKQLFLIGQPGLEMDARVDAMALHDKNTRVIEIRIDRLAQDAQAQAWTTAEYDRVLEAVLRENNTENTVFLVGQLGNIPVKLLANYRVVIVTSHKNYVLSGLTGKACIHADVIPLPELMDYAHELDKTWGAAASMLSFAFLPGYNILEITQAVLAAKPASEKELVNHVFSQYQAHDETGKSNSEVKFEMELLASQMASQDTIQRAFANMLKFRSYYAEAHRMKHLSYVVRQEFEPELKGLAENEKLLVERLQSYFEEAANNVQKWRKL